MREPCPSALTCWDLRYTPHPTSWSLAVSELAACSLPFLFYFYVFFFQRPGKVYNFFAHVMTLQWASNWECVSLDSSFSLSWEENYNEMLRLLRILFLSLLLVAFRNGHFLFPMSMMQNCSTQQLMGSSPLLLQAEAAEVRLSFRVSKAVA